MFSCEKKKFLHLQLKNLGEKMKDCLAIQSRQNICLTNND